ncbi:methylase of polypeptide subunit release factors [Neisseria sp. HSC-16F19]|nr:class I SAM-dependent methyltransferase [Neisseria sp. HSC-16F19]MCP2041092.1 methylase of polypeptide subunit release factors [Neisseria sp. HSC-16F19]
MHSDSAPSLLHWQEHGQTFSAPWLSESRHAPPKAVLPVTHISAAAALQHLHQHTALLWRGDYHQGKQLLAAVKKRVRQKRKAAADFHTLRMQQAQQSRLFHLILVEILPGSVVNNRRAPDVRAALADVYGADNEAPFLLPLQALLGFIGAHEWHKKGVPVAALGGAHIHVPFGVFSPLRGEYLDLVAHAPLAPHWRNAWDIGTGSGVLAAILAQRGLNVTGTDTNPRALSAAAANLQSLHLNAQLQAADLFPAEGMADLMVCNPPWLPAQPTSDIETALYDPKHGMLRRFLAAAPARLNADGEIWLVMSDLAEHLGLRHADELPQWICDAGLRVVAKTDTVPQHGKAQRPDDPLYAARSRETTSLWRLAAA